MFLDSNQQKGILGLILLILLLMGLIYGLRNRTSATTNKLPTPEEQEVRLFLDSICKEKSQEERNKPALLPFNPNFMTDYRGYVLGLSVKEIDRIQKYHETGSWVNSTKEFQTITQVSDSLLRKIEPYFKFPDWVKESSSKSVTKTPGEERNVKRFREDLNTATAEELKRVPGIGEVLSERIVSYRNRLGGFLGEAQLKDVYGLKREVRMRVLDYFEVKNEASLEKVDLNSATTAELTEIPYFDYELARKIVEYRITHKGFERFEELRKIEGFPFYKREQIELYVTLEAYSEMR